MRHTQFGDGTVTGQTETLVTVVFDNGNLTKKFIYPAAFDQFLSLHSTEKQEIIAAELKQIHERDEAIKKELKEKEAENIKLREKEMKSQPERKRASDKKRIASKQREVEIEIEIEPEEAGVEYEDESEE